MASKELREQAMKALDDFGDLSGAVVDNEPRRGSTIFSVRLSP